ncbi:hypothetical protein JX266_012220 [Neoarthrinium moseri]|nr:hypothetical protein JX266_012220 [Neoarthrinium moseri]
MMRSSEHSMLDVIVVGGGISGICAAIAAAENGASVIVLDRAYGGGASAISAGVIYAGGGTKQQSRAGYGDDSPENMYQYLRHEVGDAVDDATLRRFCEESAPNMEWLERHGCQFDSNEKAYPFAHLAKPAPRGHKPVGKGSGGMGMTGADLWQALFDSASRLGVKFEPASRVTEILMDSGGRVNGVHYSTLANGPWWAVRSYKWLSKAALNYQATFQPFSSFLDWIAEFIFVRGAHEERLGSPTVVLAAGGFIMNKAMTQGFAPWARKTATLGTVGDDGSGIRLGQSVGGSTSHMDRISAWRLLYPPEGLLEGIIVSQSGGRIAAEDLYGGSFTDIMIERSDGQGFLILDSVQWKKISDSNWTILWYRRIPAEFWIVNGSSTDIRRSSRRRQIRASAKQS